MTTDRAAGLYCPPEPAFFAPQWITEDAYSVDQMRREAAIGATLAMAQVCNELSAALGWPNGISAGPLPWDDLLRLVAMLRVNGRR